MMARSRVHDPGSLFGEKDGFLEDFSQALQPSTSVINETIFFQQSFSPSRLKVASGGNQMKQQRQKFVTGSIGASDTKAHRD